MNERSPLKFTARFVITASLFACSCTSFAQDQTPPTPVVTQAPAPQGKADKKKPKKDKKPKQTPINIEAGTLTVDGFTGKAALNYDIPDLKFIYIWAPGIGTTVISNEKFGPAKEQEKAFDGPNLTVTVDGHVLQISSDKRLLGKKPESAWVYLDHDFALASKYPAVGYGTLPTAPYAWPGAKQVAAASKNAVVTPPPLPVNLLPVMQAKPCVATAAVPCPTPTLAPKPVAPVPTTTQPPN